MLIFLINQGTETEVMHPSRTRASWIINRRWSSSWRTCGPGHPSSGGCSAAVRMCSTPSSLLDLCTRPCTEPSGPCYRISISTRTDRRGLILRSHLFHYGQNNAWFTSFVSRANQQFDFLFLSHKICRVCNESLQAIAVHSYLTDANQWFQRT